MSFNQVNIALLLLIHCALAAPRVGVDVMSQMETTRQRSGMVRQFTQSTDSEDYLPPVTAYIEVFPKQGENAQGYGMVSIKLKAREVEFEPINGEKKIRDPESKKPSYSYAELSGHRYFPEDTDSIRVWGLRGYPLSKHWVFLLAEGKVNAYGHYPGNFPRYFAKGKPGMSMPPDSNQTFGGDSLRNLLKPYPRAWAEAKDNPVHAVKIFNEISDKEMTLSAQGSLTHQNAIRDWFSTSERLNQILEKYPNDYLALISRAHLLCKSKKFSEAQKDLAVAQDLDSAYYLLPWTQAYCDEIRGDSSMQLAHLYQANHYAPYTWDQRKKAESQIKDLEKSATNASQYWRITKTRKPLPKSLGASY